MPTKKSSRPDPKWLQDYKNKVEVKQIAKEEGVTHQAIYLRLKKLGIPRVRRNFAADFSQEDIDNCIYLYEVGNSCSAIAEITGANNYEIAGILKQNQVKFRKAGQIPTINPVNQEAYNLRKEGKPWDEIRKQVDPKRTTFQIFSGAKYYAIKNDEPWPPIPWNIPRADITKDCIRLRKSGRTLEQIAQQLKVTKYAVKTILDENQHKVKRTGVLRTNPLSQKMYDMRKKGMSWKAIAKAVSTKKVTRTDQQCCSAVGEFAKKRGILWPLPRDSRMKTTKKEAQLYARLNKSGDTISRIAKDLGVTAHRVTTAFEQHGISINKDVANHNYIGSIAYGKRKDKWKWADIVDLLSKGGTKYNLSKVIYSTRRYCWENNLPWPV